MGRSAPGFSSDEPVSLGCLQVADAFKSEVADAEACIK
jgi:hypothetical protein